MSEVTRTPSLPSGVPPDREGRSPERERRPPPETDEAAEAELRQRRRVEDVTVIMGIPPDELTPRVQEALSIIIGEFDRIRGEYERARDRLIHLQEQIDRHPYLPVLSRPALTRELGRVLDHCRRAETTSSVVILHFSNLGGVRRAEGRAAAERVLAAGVAAATERLRGTDAAGGLGGADLGVVLAMTDAAAATDKAVEMAAVAQARVDELAPAVVRVSWGVHEFGREATAEQVLDAADRALWRARTHSSPT